MGEVYKARDTRLDRVVAIKTSHEQFSKRFELEARAIAALNHPNICTLFDVGPDYLVMEYIEGAPIKGPLPTEEAVRLAIQIAAALQEAHRKGIVHRDLKPSNILITSSGVKLLDFGLAKREPSSQDDATATLTQAGAILGTIPYMSPEQAEGKRLDARSDIFSYGAVLYEVITGQRAFAAETAPATVAAILHSEPQPITEIVQNVPRDLVRIVGRCLRKDPAKRYQVIEDVKLALEEIEPETITVAALPRRVSWLRSGWAFAWGAVLGIALSLAGGRLLPNRAKVTPEPILTRLVSGSGLATDPALSPDGKLLAYASDRSGDGGLDIWVRQVAGGDPLAVTHDQLGNREPSFSPDGSTIVFSSERERGGIYIVPALGGEPRKIAGQGRRPRFSPDGEWVAYWSGPDAYVGPRDAQRVLVVPATGGPSRLLSSGFIVARSPVWSPDGKRILFLGTGGGDTLGSDHALDWWVVPAAGGTPARLSLSTALRSGMSVPEPFVWTADQKIIFAAYLGDVRNAWQIPMATGSRTITGTPERLTAGDGIETGLSWAGSRLAFAVEIRAIDLWTIPADTNRGVVRGSMQPITRDAGANYWPMTSTDGTRMIFRSGRLGVSETWFKDFKTGKEVPVFGTAEEDHLPSLSADGTTATYTRYEGQKVSTYSIGIGSDDRFSIPRKICGDCANPWTASSDAGTLLYSPDYLQREIYALDIKSAQRKKVVETAVPMVSRPRFSPDDRWIAFQSRRGQATRIFVTRYDGTVKRDGDWIAITDGSFGEYLPQWSPDGQLLYFYSDRDGHVCLWAQNLERESKRPVGEPFPVQHFHTARQSLGNIPLIFLGMSLARDRIILNAGNATGSIWLADYHVK
jgi:Tol biopolymer transport system component/predicted Ser/Thr protein kinase